MRNIKKRINKKQTRVGIIQKRILLLLETGVMLSCARTPLAQWRVVKDLGKEWRDVDRYKLGRALTSLYKSNLVGAVRNTDGTFSITLREKGKKRVLTYAINKMRIVRSKKWDGLWRFVSFDIPEDEREIRNSLRGHLLHLGFYEMHQSFFVHAFECRDEITYIVELYDVKKYVRFMIGTEIDVTKELYDFFQLRNV
ncbi:MAG: hypothetical protein COV91_06000 [Candidatus Taylorbacteria bacterium CG11_big_fil_rev_8_21_14_0_20_46_11]|uniref:Transcriptional repressor PaaX-like central Cas2-like domain-containing protein n=1 Tax=Candidatus Taylorbacteria bacterium CG11_big_fil_rev_8_21_14_0_20_46_11 TaxID=1975025 RepID=A0A2H0KA08_9BACT|nr:MAG: hypothetical protein COV91_06000 [Candidatus Taylorbacteria bacterium CG11_big_fil_rev_8_21_14_0_20_46_11]